MSVREGGEAKETWRAGGPATEGNRESGPYPSPLGAVTSPVYSAPAGGGEALQVSPDRVPTGALPPPAPLCVGTRTELHLFSCHTPDQHQRAVVGGCVVAGLDDGAGWLVRLDRPVAEFGGQLVEGPSWPREGSCPNAHPVEREAAA